MNTSASSRDEHPQLREARWDAFLEHAPLGQFQQTSRWARVKALDGWRVNRWFVNEGRPEEGGFQLLWKPTRFGRLGYVSKGPVLPVEEPREILQSLQSLKSRAGELGLRAVIVQPPDGSSITSDDLSRQQFCRHAVPGVICATATIDLSGGREAIDRGLHRQAKRHMRAATARKVAVRLGGRADLGVFFELMRASCERQHTQPNPSRLELLEALWDAFAPQVHLAFALCDHEDVAGLLMLGHGERLTLWKKGWCSHDLESGANCLLHVVALGWGCDHGYRTADFAGLDRWTAETLVKGEPLNEAQRRSRDVFNLSLGAGPKLLPPAQVLITHPGLRALYRFGGCIPGVERWLMNRSGSV